MHGQISCLAFFKIQPYACSALSVGSHDNELNLIIMVFNNSLKVTLDWLTLNEHFHTYIIYHELKFFFYSQYTSINLIVMLVWMLWCYTYKKWNSLHLRNGWFTSVPMNWSWTVSNDFVCEWCWLAITWMLQFAAYITQSLPLWFLSWIQDHLWTCLPGVSSYVRSALLCSQVFSGDKTIFHFKRGMRGIVFHLFTKFWFT